MKRAILRFKPGSLIFVSLLAALSSMNATDLDKLRWKERVIIIYAPEGSEKQLARQEELLRSYDAELKERDTAQVILRARAENPNMAKRFGLADAGFTLLLIGKDGGEKLRSGEVISPNRLIRLIDSMPMRQDEMHQRASSLQR
jgi:hypothetical protein